MFRKIALKLIRFYQHTFSFDHGFLSRFYGNGFCRFTPTCSQYTYDAINKYGVFKGMVMGMWRIMRCNPWSKGGYDPVK